MEETYSILLTPEELDYLRNALDNKIEDAPSSERILLLIHSISEDGVRVTINQAGYNLIHHLRFGGSQFIKEWVKNPAVA